MNNHQCIQDTMKNEIKALTNTAAATVTQIYALLSKRGTGKRPLRVTTNSKGTDDQ